MSNPFDRLSLERLRRRRSEKWARYPNDVLPAFVAEMDFPLAEPIREALHEAVDLGDTGYAHPNRIADAFADFARSWFDWSVDPGRVVMVPDVMVGAAEVIRLVTKPRERVVIDTPAYPPFWKTLREYEREVVEVPLLRTSAGWDLDLAQTERAFAAGARAYLFCNPHNPTGRVFPRDRLERIAALAERYDVVVVADEIHGLLTLRGAVHVPFVSLGDRAARRAVTVTSASKAWNVAGLKCALLVAGSDEMRATLASLPSGLLDRAGHFRVIAGIAAFRHGAPWLRAALEQLDRNRRLLSELLADDLPAVRYVPPQAGYLAWLDCAPLGLGPDPAAVFLERGRVAVNRGLDFGDVGAGFVRVNMGTSTEILTEVVSRMSAAVK